MTSATVYIICALVWVGAGLGAAVYLGRAGHRSWLWYLIGAVLGLLFLPIARERARQRPRPLTPARPDGPPDSGQSGLTVLVGLDDSADSGRALADAVHMFRPVRPRLVLVSVLDHDTVEVGDPATMAESRRRLDEHADRLAADLPRPAVEMAAGPPAQALIDMAERCGADVIAVGRRGSGLSTRVLGSVADHLVHHSSHPVLLSGHGRG